MPQRKRTFDEVDAILAAISARQLHGVLFEPDPANLQFDLDKSMQLGHLSDKRDGTHVRKSAYNSVNAREFYPVATEGGTAIDSTITTLNLSAATPAVSSYPPAGIIRTIQYVRAACNAPFAANRQMRMAIYDATFEIVIYESGLAALVGTEDGLIHPTDEFTGAATYAGTRNEFDIIPTCYLRFVATGLAAAEEISIYIHHIDRMAQGLRQ